MLLHPVTCRCNDASLLTSAQQYNATAWISRLLYVAVALALGDGHNFEIKGSQMISDYGTDAVMASEGVKSTGLMSGVERVHKLGALGIGILVAMIVLISSIGVADRQSEVYVDESLKQALLVYGTARALNATISVLQSAKTPFVNVGESLDPVNDLVERFSSVMEIAIGSLVIQKVLVAVTSHVVFKVAFACAGVLLVLSLLYRSGRYALFPSRIFLTLLFLRFAVIGALLLNGVVDQTFIASQVNKEFAELRKGTGEIKTATPVAEERPPAAPSDGASPQQSGFVRKIIDALKGGADAVVETVTTTVQSMNPKLVMEKFAAVIPNLLNLMAVFILKSVLLPLFFFFMLKKAIFAMWNTRLTEGGAPPRSA